MNIFTKIKEYIVAAYRYDPDADRFWPRIDDSKDPFWNESGRAFEYAHNEFLAGLDALRTGSWIDDDEVDRITPMIQAKQEADAQWYADRLKKNGAIHE